MENPFIKSLFREVRVDHEKTTTVVAKAMNLDRLGDFETQLKTLNLGFMRSTDGQGWRCWDGDVGVSSIWDMLFLVLQ